MTACLRLFLWSCSVVLYASGCKTEDELGQLKTVNVSRDVRFGSVSIYFRRCAAIIAFEVELAYRHGQAPTAVVWQVAGHADPDDELAGYLHAALPTVQFHHGGTDGTNTDNRVLKVEIIDETIRGTLFGVFDGVVTAGEKHERRRYLVRALDGWNWVVVATNGVYTR